MNLLDLSGLLQTAIIDFSTLSILQQVKSLTLSGEASPYRPLWGSTPPTRLPGVASGLVDYYYLPCEDSFFWWLSPNCILDPMACVWFSAIESTRFLRDKLGSGVIQRDFEFLQRNKRANTAKKRRGGWLSSSFLYSSVGKELSPTEREFWQNVFQHPVHDAVFSN